MLLNTMQVVARFESQVALYQTALKDCRCVNPLSSTLLIGAHTYSGRFIVHRFPINQLMATKTWQKVTKQITYLIEKIILVNLVSS